MSGGRGQSGENENDPAKKNDSGENTAWRTTDRPVYWDASTVGGETWPSCQESRVNRKETCRQDNRLYSQQGSRMQLGPVSMTGLEAPCSSATIPATVPDGRAGAAVQPRRYRCRLQ